MVIMNSKPPAPILHTHARRSTMDGAQGFHDGAGFIKKIYDKYDEIKIWRI